MARLVKHVKNRPYLIEVEGAQKPIAICACGLSKNKPTCDGAHRRTNDEAEGELYLYDNQGRVQAPVGY